MNDQPLILNIYFPVDDPNVRPFFECLACEFAWIIKDAVAKGALGYYLKQNWRKMGLDISFRVLHSDATHLDVLFHEPGDILNHEHRRNLHFKEVHISLLFIINISRASIKAYLRYTR